MKLKVKLKFFCLIIACSQLKFACILCKTHSFLRTGSIFLRKKAEVIRNISNIGDTGFIYLCSSSKSKIYLRMVSKSCIDETPERGDEKSWTVVVCEDVFF